MRRGRRVREADEVGGRELGKLYQDGEVIVQQGDHGSCMYVVQAGKAEVVREGGHGETRLTVLGPGDLFGEMAMFGKETRSATVRALGDVRMLTVDKRTFVGRIHEDPSLAVRVMERMCYRIRDLTAELADRDAAQEGGSRRPSR